MIFKSWCSVLAFTLSSYSYSFALQTTTTTTTTTTTRQDSLHRFNTMPPLRAIYCNKQEQQEQQEQHLVLIGGGHAHAQVIKALHSQARPKHLKVTLVDPLSAATYSGMVPGCIAGLYNDVGTAQIEIQRIAAWAGMEFVQDRVVDLDLERKLVYTRNGEQPIRYDAVSIDIGSTSRDIDGVPGARRNTIPTRPIDELVQRLKQRRTQQGEINDKQPTRIVVVGGGVAGIELAMAVQAQFSSNYRGSEFGHGTRAATAQTTLVTASEKLLSDATHQQRQTLYKILHQKGIQVVHDATVERVEETAVVLANNDGQIPFDHCVWATGAAAHPLALHLQQHRNLQCTSHGWIEVDDTLQSLSHPGVFAAGDCAHISSPNIKAPPKAGVYAVRAGPILVENLTRYLRSNTSKQQDDAENNKDLKTYKPQDDFMKLLVCSRTTALGLRFGLALYGPWVLKVKDTIDRQFLKLFQNLPEATSHIQRGEYDIAQYDEADDPLEGTELPKSPCDAAALLQRTDDNVDWKQAWLVLRTMTADADYCAQVLDCSQSRRDEKLPSYPGREESSSLIAQSQ